MSGSGMNGIPGANAMGDTLEFVKNLWGSMKIPCMAMPSMSPEEIDKQIADLKAVEAWLQMNMNMLRGSIQALEVQSATLSALRSMSETFAQAASAASSAGAAAADDKPAFESPFASSKSTAAGTDNDPADAKADPAGMPGMAGMAGMTTPFANPTAWWSAVQDQFQQAVSQAVAPASNAASKTASKAAGNAEGKPARKSAAARKKPAASKEASASGAGKRSGRKPGDAA